MHSLIAITTNCISKLKLFSVILPSSTQLRWRKTPKRKPRWLPMAKSKVFRINQHPYVPPEEQQLVEDLLDEYYRIVASLRKSFQEEMKQKVVKKDILLEKQKENENFRLLLEENRKENERIKSIREEIVEREFQDDLLLWMQMAEETKLEQERAKLRVEEIVRKEKEKCKSYITFENIDQVIEEAINNPINMNFSLTVDGTITWEGKPPLKLEADINQRMSQAKANLSNVF